MKIAFFDTKPYDRQGFSEMNKQYNNEIKFLEGKLNAETAFLTNGFDTVCAFVNDEIDSKTIDILSSNGVKLLAMRCAGYNNVDIQSLRGKMRAVRVPGYSPYAVAEHTAALLFSVNRKIHKAYNRTRENNFNINGLMGMDLHGKTAGIIGTGRIGICFVNICKGIGMKVMAYDPYPRENAGIEYVTIDELYERSDIISLHCPLTPKTRYILNSQSFERMKDGVIIINTSRGQLIHTDSLIEYLKSGKVKGAGLDVYEEESEYFFEDYSDNIIKDDILARLLTFPNVIVTAHQAFFTKEAYDEIVRTTFESIKAFEENRPLEFEICFDYKSNDVVEGIQCNSK